MADEPLRPREIAGDTLSFQESTESPATPDESFEGSGVVDAPGSAGGTSVESADDFGSPEGFDINSIPEEYREAVAQIEKQFKGHFTKKTQELATQRRTYEERQADLDLLNAIRTDPETQQQLFRELAAALEVDLEGFDDEEEASGAIDPDDPGAEQQSFEDPRLTQILREQEEEQLRQEVGSVYEAALAEAAKPLGRELTPQERIIFDGLVASKMEDKGSLEDSVRAAVTDVAQIVLQLEEGIKERWIESKQAPFISSNGVAGTEKYDPTDPKSRKAYALQVAEASLKDPNT